jgi:hypothetical protein
VYKRTPCKLKHKNTQLSKPTRITTEKKAGRNTCKMCNHKELHTIRTGTEQTSLAATTTIEIIVLETPKSEAFPNLLLERTPFAG